MISNIRTLNELLKSKKINLPQILKEAKTLQKHWEKLNFFISNNIENAASTTLEIKNEDYNKSVLSGVPYSLKDNFVTKNILTTAGSSILSNFYPQYNSTVYEKLSNLNALLLHKDSMDEFGMGGTGTYCFNGICKNPYDETLIVGGSSSGGAISVATGIVPYAIASDTGDSTRFPAACVGIVGFKPSWGRISRWGLIPYAPSLDTVAIFSREIEDAAIVFDAIKGEDNQDYSIVKEPVKKMRSQKIAVFKEIYEAIYDSDLKKIFDDFIQLLISKNYEVEFISFTNIYLKVIRPTYTILANSEAASCLSNMTGINFGETEKEINWQEQIYKTRSKHFGKLVKRRLVLGSYFLFQSNQQKYYFKAKKIRRLINEELSKVFEKYGTILSPCFDGKPPKIKDAHESSMVNEEKTNYAQDNLILANFYGCPSVSFPVAIKDNFPYSICFSSDVFTDEDLLDFCKKIESYTNLKGLYIDKNKEIKFHLCNI